MMRLTSLHIAFIVLLELTWTGQWMCYFGENAFLLFAILPSYLLIKTIGAHAQFSIIWMGLFLVSNNACGQNWFNKFYCSNSKTLGYFHLIISFIFSILQLDLEMQFFVWFKIKLMFDWLLVNYLSIFAMGHWCKLLTNVSHYYY